MRTPRITLAAPLLLLLLVLPACGSVDNERTSSAGSGASGSGGGAATGTGTGTGASGGFASGTTGSGASGGSCESFHDEQGLATVEVRVINQTTQDIYLTALCGQGQMTIVDLDGQVWNDHVPCTSTCQDLQTASHIACDACAQTMLRVPPGGMRELSWSGTDMVAVDDMPASCFHDPADADDGCLRVVAAPPRTYQALISGYSECFAGEDGPCECDEQGVCWGIPGGAVASHQPVLFDHPGATDNEAIFEPCAFGCPDDDSSAAPSGR